MPLEKWCPFACEVWQINVSARFLHPSRICILHNAIFQGTFSRDCYPVYTSKKGKGWQRRRTHQIFYYIKQLLAKNRPNTPKIMLIKMCELIDDEVPDVNAFVVGPGFLPTKIHKQTLVNPERAGRNYQKTKDFYQAAEQAATYKDLHDCISWCVAQGRDVVGGRNVAAVHDPWRDAGDQLAVELKRDRDRYKLRRAGNTDSAS